MAERPLRILVGADVPPDPNSGAAGTVYATNEAFAALGHEVQAFWGPELPHRIKHWNLHYLLELPPAYAHAVEERSRGFDPDVIQLSQPHAWLAARQHLRKRRRGVFINRSHGLESMAEDALARWSDVLGAPRQGRVRGLLSRGLRGMLRKSIDRVVRYADGIVVPASDIRDALCAEHGADPARVAVVHHGIPDRFLDEPRPAMTPKRVKRLITITQYSTIKGPVFIAAAVEQAMAVDPQIELTWVCDARHHSAVRALFRVEFQSRVHLRGWRGQEELLALIDQHGIFVAHSVYEGAAKACTEAMARGLAVVSSAVGALKDHAKDSRCLHLVPVGDVDKMAGRVVALASDFSMVKETSANSILATSALRWRRCAEEQVRFYRTLAAR